MFKKPFNFVDVYLQNMYDKIIGIFTPFRIENAQRQRFLLLIYAHKVGVLNEKRCITINYYKNITL